MKTEILGEGRPEVAVVGLVHGDEVCGLRAINRFKKQIKKSKLDLQNSVKLVIANEKAFHKGERYLDTDLNRSFPGDAQSEKHEERLASKLEKELEGLKVLDLHSSESPETPFAIISGLTDECVEIAKSTGMNRLVEISYVEGGLIDGFNAAVVECGYHNSKESARVAYDSMIKFLKSQDVLEGESVSAEPDIFQVYDEAKGSDYEFVAENFEPVREGEVFAEKETDRKKAGEKFYPILMSTDGYSNMIGFKGRKVQWD